jgi:glutamate racemase
VFSGPEIDSALDSYLAPAKSHPVDTVILGCTHYPFLADSITRKLQGARLVDPAEHVVVQIRKELEVNNLLNPSSEPGTVQYYTSGSPRDFDHLAALLLEHPVTCQKASFSVKPNGALRVD